MACSRCKHNHPPFSNAAWGWAVRDAKPKPPPGQLAVVFMLGTHMDTVTGCGWARREDLVDECGVNRYTVTKATVWAIEQGLIRCLVRGHRMGDDTVTYSLWILTDPGALIPAAEVSSRATQGTVENGSQGRGRGPLRRPQRSPTRISTVPDRTPSRETKSVRPKEPTAAPAGRDSSTVLPGTVENLPAVPGPGGHLEPISGTVVASVPQSGPGPQTTQTLVAEWVDHCPHRPPGRVVGQVAKLIGEMLTEGQPYAEVRAGLALWHQKGDQHPATLPSFVHQAMNGHAGNLLAKGDERALRGAALTEHYRRLEEQGQT